MWIELCMNGVEDVVDLFVVVWCGWYGFDGDVVV